MGRPKTYDRETVARKAMEVFWLQGFHDASIDELTEHMEINRYSLFAEFGSKQGLYEAAMDFYEKEIVTHHFAVLETDEAGLEELIYVIDGFAKNARGAGSKKGCFLTNVATERAPHDAASQRSVESYVARIAAAVTRALQNAAAEGAIRCDVDTKDEGRMLTSLLLGFFVLLRAQTEPALMHGAARAARAHLDRLRP